MDLGGLDIETHPFHGEQRHPVMNHGRAEIEFAPPEKVTDWKASLARWYDWCRAGLE